MKEISSNQRSSTQATETSLFSVAVMLFENGNTWKACLDSVLTQTYERIELIICDDSSCDFCEKDVRTYVENYKDKRIERLIIIEHPEYVGPTMCRQAALKNCMGEIVSFLPGDCIFAHERVLEEIVEYFAMDEERMITAACAQAFSPEGEEIDRRRPGDRAIELLNYGDIDEQLELVVNRPEDGFIFAPAVFWKRELLEKIGGFDEAFIHLPDWPLYLKALQSGARIDCVRWIAVNYRYVERYSEYEIPDYQSYIERSSVFEERKRFLKTVAMPWIKKEGSLWMRIQCWLCIHEIEMMWMRQLKAPNMTILDRIQWNICHISALFAHGLLNLSDFKSETRQRIYRVSVFMLSVILVYYVLLYAPIRFEPWLMETIRSLSVVAIVGSCVVLLWTLIKRTLLHLYFTAARFLRRRG